MSSATLFRLSGLALLIAVVIQFAGWAIHPAGEELHHLHSAAQVPSHVIMIVSWSFALFGLIGMYVRQAGRAGKLGLASFVLVMLSVAYHFYLLIFEALVAPILAEDAAARHLIDGGGTLVHGGEALMIVTLPVVIAFPLFGVATLRAGVFPRLAGWLPIASLPAIVLMTVLVEVGPLGALGDQGITTPIAVLYYAIFAGYALAGHALWTERVPVRQPADTIVTASATA
ncbi:MAG: hypothetical protein H0V47_15735 [Chloroflexia bacterium]|nr:hypothetical protein [Chloroflexia bacterium]